MSDRNDNGRWVLPEGWVWTTIGAIRKDSSHSINPAKQPYQYFELYSVPSYPSERPDIVRGSEIGSNKQSVKENSVLLCKINPRINRVWVVGNYSEYPKIASTEWIAFDPVAGIYPKYLRYFMMQDTFRDHLAHNSSGVGGSLMRVRPSTIADYPFPIAPLPIQHLIVAEIEKQFTRLDVAVAALRRAKANLARYKAAVLKAAVEGRLVTARPQRSQKTSEVSEVSESASDLLARILAERRAQWEAANPKKPYIEPKGPDVAGLPGLPVGWVWASIGQLFDVKVGATPSRAQPAYWGGDIAWVSSGEVSFRRIYATRETITTEGMANSSTRVHPAGTVLLAMIGEGKTRGQAALLETPAANNQNAAAILCADSAVPSPWVFYWLMSRYEETRSGGSGGMQPALNSHLVKAIPIPLAPPSVMKRIVEHIEEKLSIIDSTDRLIDANLTRADRLRQGVLGKAFRGELVANGETSEVF